MNSDMTLDNFMSNINRNLYKIIDADKLMKILNKNLKLSSIDIINRIIISITYEKEIYDIKTEREWQILGRKILDYSDKVHLLIPIDKVEYIDTDTRETIDLMEFNTFEIEKALEYGIIEKVEAIRDFKIGDFFDIKNTTSIDEKAYNISKVKSDLSSLVSVFVKETKAKVEKLEDSDNNTEVYYSKSNNILFIPKIHYNSIIIQISNILFDILTENNLERYVQKNYSEYNFNCEELELLRESTIFSISSLYDAYNPSKFKEVFNKNVSISVEDLIKLLVISDDITYKVISKTKDINGEKIEDTVHSAIIAEKAEKLLDIATASALCDKMTL